MLYRWLAVGVAGVHLGFVLYVALGGLVALRWPRTVVVHAAAVAWGALVLAFSVRCPLTSAQDWLRERGGLPRLPGGFIDRYVEGVLYPARLTPLVQALVAALVLGCWLALLARGRAPAGRAARRGGSDRSAPARLPG